MKEISLKDLKQDGKNARKHNPRNIRMIEQSLRQVGAARSGVIDENGVILAGNGTYEALAAAGIEKVRVIETDGNEWVVVKRTGLSQEQKRALTIADNRSAELAEWDAPALEAQGIDLAPWFLPYELAQVGLVNDPNDPNKEYQGMPEYEQKELLGPHLLIRFQTVEEKIAFSKIIDQKITEATKTIWFPPIDYDQLNRGKVIIANND